MRKVSVSRVCARTSSPSSARASSSRSSTRRCMRSSSWRTTPSTRRTSSTPGLLAGEHLELTAHDRQRRAQLVRSVGDEPALSVEGVLEAVEHAVDRVGEDAHLVVGPLAWMRSPSRPPSISAAVRAMRRSGREVREATIQPPIPAITSGDRAGEQEGPRHAGLGALDRGRAARRSPPWRRSCCCAAAATTSRRIEPASRVACVSSRGRVEQPLRVAMHATRLALGQAALERLGQADELGLVGDHRAAMDLDDVEAGESCRTTAGRRRSCARPVRPRGAC